MNRFERAFALLAVHEGGYVNHPKDPGGATNKGVTQRTYNNYRARLGLSPRNVRQVTDNEVAAIYQVQYWDAIHADKLPEGVAYCVFDAAVNSGPARAVRWLQKEIGATIDGVIGNETLARTVRADAAALIDRYCDRRLSFMKRLRHWPTFRNGWSARVVEVRMQAKNWAEKREPAISTIAPQPKADGSLSFVGRLLSALTVLFGKEAGNENL
ncbi:glycoside hydrolase family 108 protein [Thalassobius sp. I31.1]|uniref:glycoside hydrolase family 108 protein n=1 Tax=Thalassobius sp. I31.1 TaxID=2109912 RepID=UPI0018E52760|nr:glycoside hydrolase family 108 protein [Thalassobius sp. I31.1]